MYVGLKPSPHRYVVLSAYISNATDAVYGMTLSGVAASLKCYTRMHGYRLHLMTSTKEALPYPHYAKIRGLQELFSEDTVEWVLWLDADVRILDFKYSLEALTANAGEDVHLLAINQWDGFSLADARAPHCPIINYSFLLRNSPLGRWFLSLWATLALMRHEAPQYDQFGFCFAMAGLLSHHALNTTREALLDLGGDFLHAYRACSHKDPSRQLHVEAARLGFECSEGVRGTRDANTSARLQQARVRASSSRESSASKAGLTRIGPLALISTAWRPGRTARANKEFATSFGPNDALQWLVQSNHSLPFLAHVKNTPFCEGTSTDEVYDALRSRYLEALSWCSPAEVSQLVHTAPMSLTHSQRSRLCIAALLERTRGADTRRSAIQSPKTLPLLEVHQHDAWDWVRT